MGGLRQIGGTAEEERFYDQETFEDVYLHLMDQGARSCVETPRNLLVPAYYGLYGRRCAVGCLIPSDEYREEFEGMRLEHVYRQCPSLYYVDLNLLYALRTCHDALTPARWKKRLATIAEHYHLQVPPDLEAVPLREPGITGPIEYDGSPS